MKAKVIADRIGAKLGDVLHLEEGRRSKRNSGLVGDADWGGDDSRFGFGGAVMGFAIALSGAASNSVSLVDFSTWGMVDEFKHFLPRLLELTAMGALLTEGEIILGKLSQAGWQAWPADEQASLS